MKRRFIIALLSCLTADFGILQAQTAADLQSYVLPSPNAMTFQKYVDYPVDLNTGTVDIGVPLYNIQFKDYTFPISASFHASGRTASFNFSPLGMNWALQATGMISREVRGRPDAFGNPHVEKSPATLTPQSSNYNDLIAVDQSINAAGTVSTEDSEYDIYTISINGISAKFIKRDNGQIVFLNYCPYSIVFNTSPAQIILTDDKGIIYKFGSDASGNGYTENDQSLGVPSSWFIATITTPASHSLSFKYASQLTGSATFLGSRIYKDDATIKDRASFNSNSIVQGHSGQSLFDQNYPPSSPLTFTNTGGGDEFYLSYVTEIDFDNGKINFTYNITTNNLLLDKCVVTNLQNAIIRTAHFDYTDLPGTNLFLANNNSKTVLDIIFRDNTNVDVEKYNFDYYPGVNGGDQVSFAKAKDWWGFCNVSANSYSGNRYLAFPTIDIATSGGIVSQSTNSPANCKAPSLAPKLVGMIKTIHYPTGGTADYTYEANQYTNFSGSTVDGPGIRVKQILFNDGNGSKVGKNYTYTGGSLVREPSANDYFTETRRMLIQDNASNTFTSDYVGSYKFRDYSSEPVPAASTAYRYPVHYGGVTVTDYSDANIPNGKTDYIYTFPTVHSQNYTPSDAGNCGGCVFSLYTGDNDNFKPLSFTFDEFTKPQLSGKIIEKYDPGTATYRQVSNTTYSYTTLNQVSIPQSSIYKFLELPLSTQYGSGTGLWHQQVVTNSGYLWQLYTVMDKTITAAINKPGSETTINYDDNGTQLSTVTNYYYDNLVHVNPTRVTNMTSDGKTITNYTSYAQDYPAGTAFIDALVGNHIWSQPIENVTIQTLAGVSKIRSGVVTTYTGSAIFQASKIETASAIDLASFKFSNRATGILPPTGTATTYQPDNSYVLKLTYNNYDSKNNPLTITPTNNMPVSYIWGYNQIYPIANIKNAAYTNVFYTGFEESEGNSLAGDCKTGLLSHTGGYSRTLSSLQNGSYILSYWQKSGSTWVLQNSTVSVTTGGYTMNLSGQVDEIRFYPANAQMTTYTYTPLVGMTSQCDVNNRITYYEYDGLQRLKRVRDQDYNILKSLDYQYQAASGCGSGCYILPMQTMAGTNTLSYPVGVFNVNGKLLGNATTQAGFVSVWNADTANSHRGALAVGADSMHFQMTLNTGKVLPAITGCRYYQVDLPYVKLDAARGLNGGYVDFGDGSGMHLVRSSSDTAGLVLAANTTINFIPLTDPYNSHTLAYFIHTYQGNSSKTLTFYHSDAANESASLDNINSYADAPDSNSLTYLRNLRGNIPQYTTSLGGSSYAQSTMTSVANVTNWNSIHSIKGFGLNNGDNYHPARHIGYAQDFMQNNKGLTGISTATNPDVTGYRDTTFKISRLKSDWNTYFTNLQRLVINDEHWNREDLSALKQLQTVGINSTNAAHEDYNRPLIPIPADVVDRIINQVAAGAGQTVSNGRLVIGNAGGIMPTVASTTSIQLLQSKGWIIYINGSYLPAY